MIKNIIIFVLSFLVWVGYSNKSYSNNNSSTCSIITEITRIVDKNKNTIDEKIDEKIVCKEEKKKFNKVVGISNSCRISKWIMYINNHPVEQKSLMCHKLNRGYENIPNYFVNF